MGDFENIDIHYLFDSSPNTENDSLVDIRLYESGTTNIPADLIVRKPNAYKPRTISLGPIHFGQSQVRDYEEKKEYLLKCRFPYRVRHFKKLVDNMRDHLSRIRQWYPIAENLHEAENLSKMMALDGIFLLQFLREISPMSDYENERSSIVAEIQRWAEIFYQRGADLEDIPDLEKKPAHKEQLHALTNQKVQEDILKLQNQIPLFVLQIIIEWEEETYRAVRRRMEEETDQAETRRMEKETYQAVKQRKSWIPKLKEHMGNKEEGKEKDEMPQQKEGKEKEKEKMLQDIMLQARTGTNQDLGIILKRAYPRLSPFKIREEQLIWRSDHQHILAFVYENILGQRTDLTQYNGEGKKKQSLPARAVALDKKGVKFAGYSGPLYRIHFDRSTWTFYLPRIEITERTDAVMRNLLAFELFGCEDQTKPLKRYVEMMDQLMNTGEDVELLKKRGIINHDIGTDQEVVNIWNKMSEGHDQNGEYGPIDIAIDEVKNFYESYRIWISEGVKKFLVVSSIAVCITVITAIVQTILSGLQLHHH